MRTYKLGTVHFTEDAYEVYRASVRIRERKGIVQHITLAMKMKALNADMLVREHMVLYAQAWKVLGRVLSCNLKGTKPEDLLVMDAAQKIEGIVRAFEAVTTRPFRRNASRAAIDLNKALFACVRFNYAEARYFVKRARRGMRWVFLLHHLQKDIITPLAVLLESAMRRIRADGVHPSRHIKFYRTFDSHRFATMRKKLERFGVATARCSDEDFEKPVKARFQSLIEKAKDAMAAYEWPKAKLYLSRAARIL